MLIKNGRTSERTLVDFHLLGPVGLQVDGRRLELDSNKERVLLAALALDVGRPVSMDSLVDRLWDGEAPQRARENAHTYVSRVRKHLRLAGADPHAPRIRSHAHTYVLEADPDSVDMHRFQRLTDLAGALATSEDDERIVELLTDAETLWQGEALAGLPGIWPETIRRTLAERRLYATVLRIGAMLRLGRFADSSGELSALVRQHPEDETLIGQLMLAYYGSGRYTDALRVHQQARQTLMTEYGSHPGPELTRIHRGVLTRTPADSLARGTEASTSASSSTAVPPRNLPHQPPLVGRGSEFASLVSAVGMGPADTPVTTIETINGMAGVGKSTIAVHIARSLAPRFPDGQVFLDLRAHSLTQEPLEPNAALAILLRLFGVPPDTIPVQLEELTAQWRSTLAERQALIVLDDAASPDQVSPLLPGNSPSLVIITSRRHLTGLPHALPLPLDVLAADDAINLFRTLAGKERSQDVREAARIVRLCGYLPLAIELVASRFRSRPSWTLATLGKRLMRGTGRLNEIRNADEEMVRAFDLSYGTLNQSQCTAFRYLSLHPGPDFTAPSAAALLDLTAEKTERLIEALLECHLLQEPAPDRYRYHDLLGEYARMLALSQDSDQCRERALERLTTFYMLGAERADSLAYPRRVRPDQHLDDQSSVSPCLRDGDEARVWFSAERGNLLAAEDHARTHGAPHCAARIAHALAGFLDAECHWQEASNILQHAVDHWSRTDDQPALCHALLCLSSNQASTGRYPEAADTGERALEIARKTSEQKAEMESYRVLGILYWHLGENQTAVKLHQKALAICMTAGDVWEQARCRNNIAISLLTLGEIDRALHYFEKSISGFRDTGDQSGLIRALNNLGDLYAHKGSLAQARQTFEQLLPLTESTGNLYAYAMVRTNLAAILTESGDTNPALELHRQALVDFRTLGDRKSQATAYNGLAEAHYKVGSIEESVKNHTKALDIARSIGTAQEITRALLGLGKAELALNQLSAAAEHLNATIATARRVNAPSEEARARSVLAEVRLASGEAGEAQELLRQAVLMLRSQDEQEANRISTRLAEIDQIAARSATRE